MLLRRLPEPRRAQAARERLSIQLEPLVGASIPVIVRQGHPSVGLALTSMRLERSQDGAKSSLLVDLNRTTT